MKSVRPGSGNVTAHTVDMVGASTKMHFIFSICVKLSLQFTWCSLNTYGTLADLQVWVPCCSLLQNQQQLLVQGIFHDTTVAPSLLLPGQAVCTV